MKFLLRSVCNRLTFKVYHQSVNYEDYGDFGKEKEARGKIRSAAEKLISPDTVTIIDSANYIKGFRYELWCVARAASTTCCCVVPVSNYDDCRKRNSERQEKTYTKQQFEELLLRWEEPDKNRRWESPLIPVLDEESIEEDILISAITGKGLSLINQVLTLNYEIQILNLNIYSTPTSSCYH